MDEMNTLAAELNAVLGVFSDLRVSASLVIFALILWLGWKVVTAERKRCRPKSLIKYTEARSRHCGSCRKPGATEEPDEWK